MAKKTVNRQVHNHPVKVKKVKEPFSLKKLTPQQKTRFYVILAACVLIIVALIICFSLDLFPHLDGTLNVRGGSVVAEEQDLVLNIGASNSANKAYVKLGTIDSVLDGYERDTEYSIKTDDNESDFMYRATAADAVANSYFITSTKNTASELAATAQGSVETFTGTVYATDVKSISLGGRELSYFTVDSKETKEDQDALAGATAAPELDADGNKIEKEETVLSYGRTVYAYIPVAEERCVFITVASTKDATIGLTADDLSSEEDLLTVLGQVVDTITID